MKRRTESRVVVEHLGILEHIFINDNRSESPLGEIQQATFVKDNAGTGARVLGNYVILFILDGGGMYRDARTVQSVGTGNLLLLLPDWRHSYGPATNQTWDEFYIVFRGPVFDFWRSAGILSQTKAVTRLEPIDRWLSAFTGLFAPDSSGKVMSQTAMISKLLVLLSEAFHTDEDHLAAFGSLSWIEPAKKRLNEFLNEKYDLAELAGEFGLSYDSFRKRFEEQVGVSPSGYRMQRRIETAQVLLEHSDLAHKEIAASLAFANEFSFSRRFKAVTGISPRDYRYQKVRQLNAAKARDDVPQVD